MTEPPISSTPPPPPPSPPEPPPPIVPGRPFTGEPRPVRGGGCGRPLVFGCGAVVVLLGIAAIIFVVKAKDLLAWTMRELEQQVIAAWPADATAEERARLDRGFAAALDKIQNGQVEPPALFALQRQLTKAADKAAKKTLTRDDVLDLLSGLERVGGLLRPDEEEVPAGPPAESPPPAPSGATRPAVAPPPAGAST